MVSIFIKPIIVLISLVKDQSKNGHGKNFDREVYVYGGEE